MNNILIPLDADSFGKRYTTLFVGTVLRTLVACIASFLLFPLQSGLISVFLASFSLIVYIETILEKNKNDIWQKRMTPIKANLDMAAALTVIFIAVLFTYAVVVFIETKETISVIFFPQIHDTMTHTHIVSAEFLTILSKRMAVCIIFFIVSLIFRVGSVFVLVWIASVWGVVYGASLKQGFALDLPAFKHYAMLMSLSGFAVLLIRTLSFITASMSGMFLSKALGKYKFSSSEFKQVFRAVMVIFFVSIVLLLLSVLWEYKIYN